MNKFIIKTKTVFLLGLINVIRVVLYRMALRLRIHPACYLRGKSPSGRFFRDIKNMPIDVEVADDWEVSVHLFGKQKINLTTEPPDWYENQITHTRLESINRNWWEIPDFDPGVGDIKIIWELSRMDWVLAFSQRARNGDRFSLEKLNEWINDWCKNNPPYKGANWKCGQEASIRVINLLIGAHILKQINNPCDELVLLIKLHMERVDSTLSYAVAQNNNHGTSEAAALYMGGLWLSKLGYPEANRWKKKGLYWIENRTKKLIGEMGGFSQYSLNYHRMMLDTLCIVEFWRRLMNMPGFSSQFYKHAQSATMWLYQITDLSSGRVPNVGANDGAQLLKLADTDYLDYRPSIQLALTLFYRKSACIEEGPWNNTLYWLGLALPKDKIEKQDNYNSKDIGFAVLRQGAIFALLRYPCFKFRPSQSDLLHLDLWVNGKNVLRDAGSYSYNTNLELMEYFSGVKSHNTIEFDEHDQMPRISRFLFGDWLKSNMDSNIASNKSISDIAVGYTNGFGNQHIRKVKLSDDYIIIDDDISGFKKKAVLRWRLNEDNWSMSIVDGNINLASENIILKVISAQRIIRAELNVGHESLYYNDMDVVKVLEVEVETSAIIRTTVSWRK